MQTESTLHSQVNTCIWQMLPNVSLFAVSCFMHILRIEESPENGTASAQRHRYVNFVLLLLTTNFLWNGCVLNHLHVTFVSGIFFNNQRYIWHSHNKMDLLKACFHNIGIFLNGMNVLQDDCVRLVSDLKAS